MSKWLSSQSLFFKIIYTELWKQLVKYSNIMFGTFRLKYNVIKPYHILTTAFQMNVGERQMATCWIPCTSSLRPSTYLFLSTVDQVGPEIDSCSTLCSPSKGQNLNFIECFLYDINLSEPSLGFEIATDALHCQKLCQVSRQAWKQDGASAMKTKQLFERIFCDACIMYF